MPVGCRLLASNPLPDNGIGGIAEKMRTWEAGYTLL